MNDVSGIIEDGILEVFPDLSEISVISLHGPFVISKAKRFGKWVKLKSLSPEYQGFTLYEEQLKKEFAIGIRLDHPCIARTDAFLDDETLGNCILEEYVEGQTLGEWLSTHPTRQQRRNVARQLLQAVEYIHTQGVVHKDIKPSNIIVTSIGSNVKLIDFGLSDTSEYAILKLRAGTSGFIAPELQDGGVGPDYDWTLADIYSLGVVLAQLTPGWSYRQTARRATRRDPSRRWASIRQMMRSLDRRQNVIHGVCILATAILLVSSSVFITLHSIENSSTESLSDVNLERAYLQADSVLVSYFNELETLLYRYDNPIEWNYATLDFYDKFGYPIQFADSITARYAAQNGLDENTAALLKTRLHTGMNNLYNGKYYPMYRKRWE